MTKEEIEDGLTSPDLEVRKKFAEDNAIFDSLGDYQIGRGLADKNPIIRYIFAKKSLQKGDIPDKQMESGIKDTNASVRALFIQKYKKFSTKNIELLCLKDLPFEVKAALIKNTHIVFTNEQKNIIFNSYDKRVIELLIQTYKVSDEAKRNELRNNSNVKIRRAVLSLSPYLYSKYSIERVLIDQFSSIKMCLARFSVIDKTSYISYYQLERGLMDKNHNIRSSFINTNLPFYNKKQIARGLNDSSLHVRSLFIRNNQIELTDGQVRDIFKSDNYEMIRQFASRATHKLTGYQMDMGLTSKYTNIREIFAIKRIILNDNQIKRGLNDSDEKVVAAFIRRGDSLRVIDAKAIETLSKNKSPIVKRELVVKIGIKFTDEQIESLLEDNDKHNRYLLSKKANVKPKEKQTDIVTLDAHERLVLAILGRDDITLTNRQIECLLKNNKKTVILQTIKQRKEYARYKTTPTIRSF